MIILTCVLAYLLVGFLIATIVAKISGGHRRVDGFLLLVIILTWPALLTGAGIGLVFWCLTKLLDNYVVWLKSSKKNSAPAEGEW